MLVTQLHSLVNNVTKEVLGDSIILKEDLSNVVDVGVTVFDSDKVDNFVKKLVDHIGKVIFVNRVYSGSVPSALMDSWEFGSVLEKISSDLPDAQENSSWDLTDGETYSQDTFVKPNVTAKFFNTKVTFEIQMSFTEKQLKSAFSNAEQLNGFISMLHTSVENSLTVKLDSLVMRAFNNFSAHVFNSDTVGVQAVNLLTKYNEAYSKSLTVDACLQDADFIRFATYQMALVSDRMTKVSKLFNAGAKARFTPKDLQNIVLLSDFSKASETFLLSDTRNPEKVTLPTHDSVPFWQGSGVDYSFGDVSKISVTIPDGDTKKDVEITGILGVICDKEAVAVANVDRRTTVAYNARAEFYNNWFKADVQYINDLDENYVLFYVAD